MLIAVFLRNTTGVNSNAVVVLSPATSFHCDQDRESFILEKSATCRLSDNFVSDDRGAPKRIKSNGEI